MNIKDAKKELLHTIQVYTRKDAHGRYLMPAMRQRPLLLIGPPGIGKTAALLLGIGGASNYNLEMGAGKERKASEIAGSALTTLVITGVSVAARLLLLMLCLV